MDYEYTYDGKFDGNILIVEQTSCGKTTFIQTLAKNNMFSDLKEIYLITKVPLSNEGKKEISNHALINKLILNIHKL